MKRWLWAIPGVPAYLLALGAAYQHRWNHEFVRLYDRAPITLWVAVGKVAMHHAIGLVAFALIWWFLMRQDARRAT